MNGAPLSETRFSTRSACKSIPEQLKSYTVSPSARQFRLPFNGLAPSELRRIFCSDETPLMPHAFYARDHPGLSSMGGGSVCPRLFAPADDRNAPATPSAGGAIQPRPRSIGLVSPATV